MAIASATVWEIRTTGNDTNGGGFVAGAAGTDWSQQDSAQYSVTDAVGAGTTAITSAAANFGTDVVGNICYFDGAWYQITARPSTTEITVDRATTTGTGLDLNIGGALASLGQVAGINTGSNIIYIKLGTYVITTTSGNVSGGPVSNPAGATYPPTRFVGYDTDRSLFNTDTRPVIEVDDSGVDTITILAGGSGVEFHNLIVDGKNKTAVKGIRVSQYNERITRCEARNCTNRGIDGDTNSAVRIVGCTAIGCNIGFYGRTIFHCWAEDCTSHGFDVVWANVYGCVSINNGGRGFNSEVYQGVVSNCTAYGNVGDGFRAGYQLGTYINCLSYGNGGYGFAGDGLSNGVVMLHNCAAGSNTSGNFINLDLRGGTISLTDDPFVNAAAGDFSLNNSIGGGTLLRGAGYPQSLPVE